MDAPPTRSGLPRPCSVADISDLLLDKGLVIDAHAVVALAGLELFTADARFVVASLDTYLHWAEGVNRLDLFPNELHGTPALNTADHIGGTLSRGRQNRGAAQP